MTNVASEFTRKESLGYRLNIAARLINATLLRRIAPHGVGVGPFPVLLALWDTDGQTQADLCRLIAVEQPTMANTLKRMERDGLIRRERDPNDGRRYRLWLTDKAKSLRQPLTEAADEVNELAQRALTPAERETFGALLDKIAETVQAELGGA